MRYIKPNYYEKFKCIAGQCPDTCCAGWNIDIDDESLDKYESVPGEFGECLRQAIDWEYGVFQQKDGFCMLLDDRKLCRIYSHMSPDDMCRTCREYPRHIEEYLDEREYSLSISCPWAAKLIAENEKLEFVISEQEEYDDFEEFDSELYDILKQARKQMFDWIQDDSIDFSTRHEYMLSLAEQIQDWIDGGRESAFTLNIQENRSDAQMSMTDAYHHFKNQFYIFTELELQREDWADILDDTWNALFEISKEEYLGLQNAFTEYLKTQTEIDLNHILLQVELYYMYVYFSGAVYDDMVYEKVSLVIFSVQWMVEFIMARWKMNGEKLSLEDIIEIIYKYAREIEHSDDNLEILEELIQ